MYLLRSKNLQHFIQQTLVFVVTAAMVIPWPLVSYAQEATPEQLPILFNLPDVVVDEPVSEEVVFPPLSELIPTGAETIPSDTETVASEVPLVSEEVPSSDPVLTGALSEESAVESLPVEADVAPLEGEMMAMSGSGQEFYGPVDPFLKSQSIKTDTITGALVFEYPFGFPKGRGKETPPLSFVYNSNDRKVDTVLGLGWSPSIPYIERINKTGTNRLYTDSFYSSSLSGELATTSAGSTFYARTETGDWHTYTKVDANTWTMTDRDGTTFTFGGSGGKQADPNDSTKIVRWYLTEIRDKNDNYSTLTYFTNAGMIYPDVITYAGHGSTPGSYTVTFTREARTDMGPQYPYGYELHTNYRTSQVELAHNGVALRRHAIAYGTGTDLRSPLITSITASGKGTDGNWTTGQPSTFSYNTQKGWSTTSTTIPNVAPNSADFNGDGFLDRFENAPCINDGKGSYNCSAGWAFPTTSPQAITNANSMYFRFGDLNADGYADIVMSYLSFIVFTPTTTKKVYINNKNGGWSEDASWVPPGPFADENWYYSVDMGPSQATLMDVNLDGFSDFITDNTVHLNTGTGWATSTITTPGDMYLRVDTFNGSNYSVQGNATSLVEVNGDGVPDWVIADGTMPCGTCDYSVTDGRVYLSNGNGWVLSATTTGYFPPGPINDYVIGSGYSPTGYFFSDVNGDGLSDVVRYWDGNPPYQSPMRKVFINTGVNWTEDTSFSFHTTLSGLDDPNDDLLADYVGTSATYPNLLKAPDMMAKITYPSGGVVAVKYTQSYAPQHVWSVSELGVYDGINTDAATTTYSYATPRAYKNPHRYMDKRFAGFASTTATNAQGTKTISYFHQGDGNDTASGEVDDSYFAIGRAYRTDVLDAASTTLRKVFTPFTTTALASASSTATSTATTTLRAFVRPKERVEVFTDSGGSPRARATTYAFNTDNGTLATTTEYGEVSANSDGTFSDTGTDSRRTEITYAIATTSTLIAPSTIATYNHASTKVKETRKTYDGLSFGTVSKGNETKTEQWISGSTYATETRTFDTRGLPTQLVDARGSTTTLAYDSYYLSPTTITNALNHQSTRTYDYASGNTILTTDANGGKSETQYDGLNRPVTYSESDPATPSTLLTHTTYSYTDTVFPRRTLTTSHLSSATSSETYSYRDGVGNVVQERREVEGSNTYSVRDRAFTKGLLTRESFPYLASSTTHTTATTSTSITTAHTYDALNRIASSTSPVGTTRVTYAPWKSTFIDARSISKDLEHDAFDNLAFVTERNGSDTYLTSYAYDALGNLTKITDALGNIRNFTYDGLSRRTTAEDLHAPSDGTYGTWSYTFDAAGNETSRSDPNGNTIESAYDALNRITTENYTGLSGTEVTYTYDSCTYGTGRLCLASTTDAKTAYTYTPRGLVASEARTIFNTAYTTQFAYDRQGNLSTLTYPDGRTATYTSDTAGMPESLVTSLSGTNTTVMNGTKYAPHLAVRERAFGNGLLTTYTYDPAKAYRLTNLFTSTSTPYVSGDIPTILTDTFDRADGSAIGGAWTDNTDTNDNIHISGNKFRMRWVSQGWGGFHSAYQSLSQHNNLKITYTWRLDSGVTIDGYFPMVGLRSTGANNDSSSYGIALHYTGQSTDRIDMHVIDNGTLRANVQALSAPQKNTDYKVEIQVNSQNHVEMRIWPATSTRPTNANASFTNSGNTYTPSANGGNLLLLALHGSGAAHSVTAHVDDFTVQDLNATSSGQSGTPIGFQNMSYTYDAVGNITAIADTSSSTARKDVLYQYDDLNRLTVATTTSSHASYKESFTYNALGNILTKVSGTSGGATALFSDDFTRANSSSIGNGWTDSTDTNDNIQIASNKLRMQWVSQPWGGFHSAYRSLSKQNDITIAYVWRIISGNIDAQLPYIGVRSTGANNDSSAYAASLLYNGATDKISVLILDNGSVKTYAQDVISAPTKDADYNVEILINAQNHMEIRIWLASSSRPSTATASFTNGGSTYTPAASGSNLIAMATHGSGNSYSVHATLDNLTVYDGISGSGGSGSGTTYTYAGTNYANPHAPTTIGSRSLSYDNNGNLTTLGTTTHTWDYKNRLTRTVGNSATTTYGYDHTGQRVWMATNGTATTTYINKWYDIFATKSGATTTATTTSSFFTGDTLVGSITTTSTNGAATTTPAISYIHTDHLNSTNVVTNASGTVVQVLDYYPFGAGRINNSTGGFDSKKKFIGIDRDAETGLDYALNRYYANERGQFILQDPTFLTIGDRAALQNLTGLSQEAILADPQQLNSYSYGRNNPIRFKDPKGLYIETPLELGLLAFDAGMVAHAYFTDGDVGEQLGYLGLDAAGLAVPAGGFGLATRATVAASKAGNAAEKTYQVYAKVGEKADDIYIGRTSGTRSAEANVKARDSNHHMTSRGYSPAQLLISTKSYDAVRGLEQLGQNYAKSIGQLANQIRGISPSNPNLGLYLQAAQKQVKELQAAINKLIGK